MMVCFFWISIAVISAIIEASTFSVVGIWFMLGATSAMLAYIAGVELWKQILLFSFVTAVGVFYSHRVWLKKGKLTTYVNLDRYIGQSAYVTEPINNLKGTGGIKLDGQHWAARADINDLPIPVGERVYIERFDGGCAIVSTHQKSMHEISHKSTCG